MFKGKIDHAEKDMDRQHFGKIFNKFALTLGGKFCHQITCGFSRNAF